MMKQVMFFLFVLICHCAIAGDSIIVKKDPRMDVLSVKQAEANKRSAMMTANGLYKGFRIQVVNTSKRDDAFKIKADLDTKFPAQKTYISFESPNFKVKIGNFLRKEDAQKLKTELNKLFPQGVYIVEDGVEYTLKEGEDILTQ